MIDKSIQVNNAAGAVVNSGEVGGDIVVRSTNTVTTEDQKTLAEAAAEIQQLLDQLSETYPTTTAAEKATVAAKAMQEIEGKPDTKKRIIKALKVGGAAALTELTNNPVVKILTPMLSSLLEDGK
jgi:predicted transcriptional regulator